MMDQVYLDLRGKRFELERTRLLDLPESVLLCLFPNGVSLGESMDIEDTIYVDFDGDCLEYLLAFFDRARFDFYGAETSALRQQRVFAENAAQQSLQIPLFHKQAIIVLREELEYFAIPSNLSHPPSSASGGRPLADISNTVGQGAQHTPATDEHGNANPALMHVKAECGKDLLGRRSIFTALQRNVNRENNVAEQHLIDMLCMSGFEREDEWGYRSMEPNRCCITSIALVLLKTGISQPDASAEADSARHVDAQASQSPPPVNVNSAQLATAQKLLLFWRKPARKCWWDAMEIETPAVDGKALKSKIHVRRIWTLELSCI